MQGWFLFPYFNRLEHNSSLLHSCIFVIKEAYLYLAKVFKEKKMGTKMEKRFTN